MTEIARLDSKGRVSIPRELREILSDTVEIKRVGKSGVLISPIKKEHSSKSKEEDNFSKLIDKEPRRTGKPENIGPAKIKSIWKE